MIVVYGFAVVLALVDTFSLCQMLEPTHIHCLRLDRIAFEHVIVDRSG